MMGHAGSVLAVFGDHGIAAFRAGARRSVLQQAVAVGAGYALVSL